MPIWLGLQVVAAPVRYLLDLAHLSPLVYLPSIALALATGLLMIGERPRPRVVAARWLLLLVTLSACRAAIVGLPWKQIAFGAWILLPLFAGLLAPPALLRRFGRLFGILFAVAAIGVVSESLLGPWAWQGHVSQIAGFAVEANRAWMQPGVASGAAWQRLAGFSRFSYAAASQLLMLGIAWEAFGLGGPPRLMIRIGGFAASLLTTSKGILLAWLVVSASDALRPWRRNTWRVAFLAPAVAACVLPFMSSFVPVPDAASYGGVATLAASMGDRMHDVWPAAIAATVRGDGLWLGGGLGAAGTAQWYFDRASYNPVDNVALFVFLQAGVVGLALLGAAIVKITVWIRGATSMARWSVRVVVVTAVYAMTTSVLESPEFALFCGLAIAQLMRARR